MFVAVENDRTKVPLSLKLLRYEVLVSEAPNSVGSFGHSDRAPEKAPLSEDVVCHYRPAD
jgi:hypothetical protein